MLTDEDKSHIRPENAQKTGFLQKKDGDWGIGYNTHASQCTSNNRNMRTTA